MTSYCDAAPGHPWHGPYHDREYGFPVTGESVLFERFVLEINQAGLSWLTILKKRENFRKAFKGFDFEKVARFNEASVRRLMNDAALAISKARHSAASLDSRSAMTRFSRTVPLKRKLSCVTYPIASRSESFLSPDTQCPSIDTVPVSCS